MQLTFTVIMLSQPDSNNMEKNETVRVFDNEYCYYTDLLTSISTHFSFESALNDNRYFFSCKIIYFFPYVDIPELILSTQNTNTIECAFFSLLSN